MTGLACAWSSIAVLFVLVIPLCASTLASQKPQQQQQKQHQHQQQHPRIHNSHKNQACRSGFESFGNYCLHYDNGGVTQASAVDYCTSLGATLTYPINPHDLEAWKTAVYDAAHTGSDYPWSGATLQADGEWTWVDGTQVPAAAWATGQPGGDESCTYVKWLSDKGSLYDFWCSGTSTVLCQVTLEATTTTELPETTNPTVPSETTIRTETTMTPTELPETTNPTVPSETTIWTENPTTTADQLECCYSCMDCPDVDDTTNTEPKYEDQSCFTAIYGTGDIVIRGVSQEFHQDGDCQLINNILYCFCNTHLCNGHHAINNIDSLVHYENTQIV